MSVGILAFGSLVETPGAEIEAHTIRRIDGVTTPFAVEFARSSRTRDGAPTLVPVATGGGRVAAAILILDEDVGQEQARDLIYRRETWQIGQEITYRESGATWVATLAGYEGIGVCVYTALEANIDPLTVSRLAELALESARRTAGAKRRDGISYLAEQKRRGTVTPLMPPYEAEVLTRTGAKSLADAWTGIRATC